VLVEAREKIPSVDPSGTTLCGVCHGSGLSLVTLRLTHSWARSVTCLGTQERAVSLTKAPCAVTGGCSVKTNPRHCLQRNNGSAHSDGHDHEKGDIYVRRLRTCSNRESPVW
jgi:hypothetical protein